MPINFLTKYQKLLKSIPVPAVRITNLQNCQNVDYTHNSQNCQFCFLMINGDNCFYCNDSAGKMLVDCSNCLLCELCYECIECIESFNCFYSKNLTSCRSCFFCNQCVACSDCFGCVGLSHKTYCLFNKQLSKQEYEKQVSQLKFNNVQEQLDKLEKLTASIPQPASFQQSNENCPYGDYIHHCQDVYWAFSAYYSQRCGYLYLSGLAKDCWDLSYSAGSTKEIGKDVIELSYDCGGGGSLYHCAYTNYCSYCTNCYYCSDCQNCSDCFGCIGLKNKKYCILNNQLNKEQYEKAILEVKKELGWPLKH